MSEPTIICPHCKEEIKLTESLAAPLIESTREQFKRQLADKDKDIAERETAVSEIEKSLAREKKSLDERISSQVEERLTKQRGQIAEEEAKKAQLKSSSDLEQKTKEIADLQEVLKVNDDKLADAQKAHADVLKKEREIDEAKREIDLTVEKRVTKGLADTREQAKKEAEETWKLNLAEKDQTISSMKNTIEELRQKADQGSQQLQGEVQELELEEMLQRDFPFDTIEPVPKGVLGADVIQHVVSPAGQQCGAILWESKRTKRWSDGWLPKLRDDRRNAQAQIAVIVSQALPKNIDSFDLIDGVCVAHPRLVFPVATLLRQSLIEVAQTRLASEGQQTKTEMVYEYLTGSRFRLRIEAIAEAFSTMQEDLVREKRAITKQWAKRDEEINRMMQATVGMYGDLQGIAGKSLQEIEGLELDPSGSEDPAVLLSVDGHENEVVEDA